MKDLKFIAQQLRKPSGDFANKIAAKMQEGNQPLYNLTRNTMEIFENDTILEIGFGSGIHFKNFLSLNNGLQLYGIDYSDEMVELATVNNEAFIETGQLILAKASSDLLPFEDEKFDKIFCNMVVYFWDEPEKHLEEIYRVLKPGGLFYTGMRSRESMREFPFTQFGFNLYTEEQWCTILEENGFKIQGSAYQTDPDFEDNGNIIQLESLCIYAMKMKN